MSNPREGFVRFSLGIRCISNLHTDNRSLFW